VIGHDHLEHRVTEELEALVRLLAKDLRTPRTVGKGLLEHEKVLRSPSQSLGQGDRLFESVDARPVQVS
jgi:hypothetical protein